MNFIETSSEFFHFLQEAHWVLFLSFLWRSLTFFSSSLWALRFSSRLRESSWPIFLVSSWTWKISQESPSCHAGWSPTRNMSRESKQNIPIQNNGISKTDPVSTPDIFLPGFALFSTYLGGFLETETTNSATFFKGSLMEWPNHKDWVRTFCPLPSRNKCCVLPAFSALRWWSCLQKEWMTWAASSGNWRSVCFSPISSSS